MAATIETLRHMDRLLAAEGIPPLTRWWDPTLEAFLTHATARTLAAEVGRAGAKSHTVTKCAANEVLFGDWEVPPGERHYFALVSENKSEAFQRLRLLEKILSALHIPYERRGDEIALVDRPPGFRVFASDIGAVSGFRCVGFACDEVAKWPSEGSDPADEIVASLRAMTITHRAAREFIVSSPVGKTGFRYDLCRSTDIRVFSVNAPSWVANPDAITEEETHRRESEPRVHAREYGAQPQDARLAAFPAEAIARAFRRPPPYEHTGRRPHRRRSEFRQEGHVELGGRLVGSRAARAPLQRHFRAHPSQRRGAGFRRTLVQPTPLRRRSVEGAGT